MILFVVLTPSQTSLISFLEKVGLAIVFILCCIIGISFTIRPNWIRHYFPKTKNLEKNIQLDFKRSFQGHHPDCLIFKNHTIQLRGKTWCAGCLGLFIGLCSAIVIMILYLITDIQLTNVMSLLFLIFGLFTLAVVFIEILHRSRHAIVHVFINSLMPVSFFLITIAVSSITGEFIYGFFSILMCFLWLDTRIHFSKSRHRILCTECSESCKMFTVPI